MLTLEHYVDDFVTWHLGEIFEALYLTDSVAKICRIKRTYKMFGFKLQRIFWHLMSGGKKAL